MRAMHERRVMITSTALSITKMSSEMRPVSGYVMAYMTGGTSGCTHLPGSLHSLVDILLLSLCNLHQHLASAGILSLKSLSAAGVHKLTVDEQLQRRTETPHSVILRRLL